ncbi:nuclear receptor coactivator 5 [Hyla sarda]|uniref:nuclear receptor coactivator 5 n=1 Tax=Hyla sarda TaxID=327740 RepID=UPI0024C36664|nr:nuclear receptor coactivator 5 [Hyla sarda]
MTLRLLGKPASGRGQRSKKEDEDDEFFHWDLSNMSHRRKSASPSRNRTDSDDPKDLDRRIFVGNLPTDSMNREEMEIMFSKYGKITALSVFRRFGFVQYERKEDADAAVQGERGRMFKGSRLDINKAAERRNNRFKGQSKSSPPRRDGHSSRDARDLRDASAPRDYRDSRDSKDLRDARDLRVRDPRDSREPPTDSLYDRYRDARDTRNPYRVDVLDDYYRKREELYDRYKEPLDKHPEDRYKREDRRREELYRQYFDELQRKLDQDRRVDCSVIVSNKQSKEYAESVGRKIRDLGMLVDLIFLNTEVSLSQVLEDVTRGGTPFAIAITQQHQTHRSCTVNILFGTPQEHRNMPLADAMVLIARNFERYKVEKRDKEREDIARQAAKLSTDAFLRERAVALDEGLRAPPPSGIMALLNLLADNRYVTPEEIDKVIIYLRDRKERMLALTGEPISSQLSRPLGTNSGPALESSSTLASSQAMQVTPQLSSGAPAAQTPSSSQQELQAKILSLFNSGSSTSAVNANPTSSGATTAQGQSYGNVASVQRAAVQMDVSSIGQSVQRSQPIVNQHPGSLTQGEAVRSAASRPGPQSQMQNMYGQLRPQAPNNVAIQRPGAPVGINFANPSVQKALDTLIQSGPALSHLVNQTADVDENSLLIFCQYNPCLLQRHADEAMRNSCTCAGMEDLVLQFTCKGIKGRMVEASEVSEH